MDTLRKKSVTDLQKMLVEKREGLRAFRFGEAGSRTRNVREGRETRRQIARIMTELRARELASQQELPEGK